MSNHVSDAKMDALRLGQLDEAAESALDVHFAACDECRDRRAALEADAAAFDIPLDAEAILTASSKVRVPSFGRRAALLVLGTAAAAAFVFFGRPDDTVRTKGGDAALELYIVDGDEVRRAKGSVPVGSTLRLRFDPKEHTYVRMWWGGDALWPAAGAPAVALTSPRPQWLDRPIVLDDDPSPERLEAVFCDRPMGDAARQTPPEGCRHVQLEVRKAP